MGVIDDAFDRVCDEIISANPTMLATYYDLSLDGSQAYYLPDLIPWNYESILLVENITGGVDDAEATITTIWGDRMRYVEGWPLTYGRIIWSIRDQYIELPNKETTGTLRIWYPKRPAGLFYGSASAGATTTSVTIATATVGQLVAETNHYIGMYIIHDTQARRISANTTAGVFTVSAWTTAPSENDVLDLVSPLPRAYQQRAIREAQIAIRAGGDDPIGDLVMLSDREAPDMTRRLRKSGIQGPEYIRRVDR